MGRTLVLHVPLSSPVARSPALLVFTCSPWKRAAKDPLRCVKVKNYGFEKYVNLNFSLIVSNRLTKK